MGRDRVLEKIAEIKDLAVEGGLDFFPVIFEFVNRDIMLEACSYGLPIRARHWSYGRSYQHQKIYGEMGLSKVYEIVFNNDPSYAFLMNTNPDIINIMVGAHVFGHCVKYDQLVDTSSGVKKISDVIAGDMVLTHTGDFKRVVRSEETTRSNEIYKIKAYGYPEIECTSDHRFYVKRDGGTEWVAAKNLLSTDMLAIPRIKPRCLIDSVKIPISISRTTPLRKKALADEGYVFDLDYDFGRMVGLYLAEGSTSVNRFTFTFGGGEQKYADFISDYFKKYGITVRVKNRSPDQHCIDVQCFDKSMTEWFDKNFGHGCENKSLPKWLSHSGNLDFYNGVLRGYFDGDGWVKDGNTSASASTVSLDLAYQVKNMCAMFGIKVGINHRNRDNRRPSYDILATGKNYDKLLGICEIERQNVPERRWLFNEVDNDHIYNRIKDISVEYEDEPVPMWDLEVEENHSFTLSNGAIAHNCHFFKHNVMFQGSDRNMIYRAAERASRIDKYIEQYGLDKVEHLMDIGFALDNHIDWRKGVFRKKYPGRKIHERKIKFGEFEDLLNIGDYSKRSVKRFVTGDKLPPVPERDILWFLVNYAPLEEWEKDVLEIIREESYYFYPIVATKIMNEGFASFWHAELMYKYDGIEEEEFLEFCKCHSSVVQPGSPFNINPYYLGFKILTDIREKWDKLHEEGKSCINGIQKIIQVAAEEDDASFLRNYLTVELATELGLFNYGYKLHREPDMKEDKLTYEHGLVELKDRELDKIIEHLTRPIMNYGAPLITITEADGDTLIMKHEDKFGPLDVKYTEKTMEYIYELWGGPVELRTYKNNGEEFIFCFDESGFDTM
jgi:stage V sporulation protein R